MFLWVVLWESVFIFLSMTGGISGANIKGLYILFVCEIYFFLETHKSSLSYPMQLHRKKVFQISDNIFKFIVYM